MNGSNLLSRRSVKHYETMRVLVIAVIILTFYPTSKIQLICQNDVFFPYFCTLTKPR